MIATMLLVDHNYLISISSTVSHRRTRRQTQIKMKQIHFVRKHIMRLGTHAFLRKSISECLILCSSEWRNVKIRICNYVICNRLSPRLIFPWDIPWICEFLCVFLLVLSSEFWIKRFLKKNLPKKIWLQLVTY